MNVEFHDSFFKELKELKRGDEFSLDILQRTELLCEHKGFIVGHSKRIKGHKPLIQLRYNDVRIFYTLENNTIIIRGILKKDVDKFKSEAFKKMNNK